METRIDQPQPVVPAPKYRSSSDYRRDHGKESRLQDALLAYRASRMLGSALPPRWAEDCFMSLVRRRALACCRKWLRDPQVAAELTQDVAMVVWEHRDELRGQHEGELVSYIRTVAKHKCLEHLRRKPLARGHYVALDDLYGIDAESDSRADQAGRQAGARLALMLATAHAVDLVVEQHPKDLWAESGARQVPRTRAGVERNIRVALLCAKGHNAREVGDELGLTRDAVYQAKKRGIAAIAFGAKRARRLEAGLDLWTRDQLERLADRT